MNIIAKIKSLQRRVEALEAAAGVGQAHITGDENAALTKNSLESFKHLHLPLDVYVTQPDAAPPMHVAADAVKKKGRRRGT